MKPKQTAKVPTGRLSRLSKLGGLASRIAGNMLVDGVKQVSRGQSPKMQDLIMTPKNIGHVADKLAQLRGAAMKVGQMLSMDAGDLLPKELTDILARLRSDAKVMPHKQLIQILEQNWGKDWIEPFSHFDLRPFAAASIGQVHQATLANGQKLAIKIQYPGIRESIDSDVDNVASLLKLARLIPEQIDISGLLIEAKSQLHNEADYRYEAEQLLKYKQAIAKDAHFCIPDFIKSLSTENILCMEYVNGQPIESVAELDQATKDRVMSQLMALFFAELFEYQLIQSDPNFANFQYNPETQKVVLLDFGATRTVGEDIAKGYNQLMLAASNNDKQSMATAAEAIGFFKADIVEHQKQMILDIFHLACEPIRSDGPYDFGSSELAQRIKDAGMVLSTEQDHWHTPPTDALYIHRKLGGLYLLAATLQARVDVAALFKPYGNQ